MLYVGSLCYARVEVERCPATNVKVRCEYHQSTSFENLLFRVAVAVQMRRPELDKEVMMKKKGMV